MKSLKIFLSAIVLCSVFAQAHTNNTATGSDTLTFYCNELLGRPTANSITVHACANKNMDVYYEYGTDSSSYASQTTTQSTLDSIPFVAVLKDLSPNTQYYYRMRYRVSGLTDFSAKASHTFHTQRPSGSNFTFAVEADPHLDTNSTPASYTLTLQNILSQKPDFLFDLGDTFMSEKLASKTQSEITRRHLLLRSYFDLTCHSVPLYLVIGNHEGESGWLLNGTATSLPVLTSNTRTLFYPNPLPDSFYSGNTTPENFVGLRQNYYAFEWGNSLFMVIDPYWYTTTKPGWGWTLGQAQYDWFKKTLQTSKAKFKFVFCHQLVGGNGNDARGGTEYVDFFESGGKNADSTWGFSTYRPTWDKPLHQLMVENGVTIYFHGHDHFYDKQEKDGVIYQEVPQPSNRNIKNTSAASYGYTEGVILPGRGYLALSITDTSAQVQYIKTLLTSEETATTHNKDVAHSYSIIKSNTSTAVKEFNPKAGRFALDQNYPNPFNPSTRIQYQIENADNVTLRIYNALGQTVETLVQEYQQPGQYTVEFNPQLNRMSSGIYYCRVISGSQSKVIKMMYLK